MALNIPVNLMAGIGAPTPSQTASDTSSTTDSMTAIQPAFAGADARGATADGESNFGDSRQQTSQRLMQRMQGDILLEAPARAEPKSVVNAQTVSSPFVTVEPQQKSEQPAVLAKTGSELERYAPPTPLPTAPILKLAESYAALTRRAA